MLVAARLVLGRGGALAVALGYLGFRVGVAVFVGWGIDHTAPHVPLHLVSAAAVEAVGLALGVARRLRFVAVSGLALATVGLAGERAWVGAVAPHSWGDGLLPDLLLPGGLAAVGGAVLGGALGGLASRSGPLPAAIVAAGAAAVVVVVVVPFPRTEDRLRAEVSLEHRGGDALVEVQLDRPVSPSGIRWFEAFAWQGGGLVRAAMEEAANGVWRSRSAVPVEGDWKTVVRLHRGSDLVAFPVYFPADPEIGARAVPAADRTARAIGDSDLLLREVRQGPAWPALVAWAGIVGVLAAWAATVIAAVRRHARR